jgi:NAD(P)-dependent dehydrogenase (short-subunit alcohol dehydrogenase family)
MVPEGSRDSGNAPVVGRQARTVVLESRSDKAIWRELMSFQPFDLKGKVGLVTGGNSGIGLGMARGMAEAGADICIWGTNEEKNAAAADQLKSHGTRVLALRCDVGDRAQVQAAFAETLAKLGRVDACFANAGVGSRGTPFRDMSLEEWRAVFRVNMEGVVFTFQAAIHHMLERGGGGSLVATSSGTAIFGAPRGEHYAATKAGLGSLVRSIAVEHARDGIRANMVIPGWIETPMTKRAVASPKFQEKVLTRIPLRRWGQPADFSGLAIYLASDASAYHTGDTLMIDGGYAAF